MTVEQLHPQLPPRERPKTAGQMLSEARERLGLSTTEVATITRIPRVMLEHLERDQFHEYCAPVFIKGHLSNFARAVRVDAERVLIAYERQMGLSIERARPVEAPAAPLLKPGLGLRALAEAPRAVSPPAPVIAASAPQAAPSMAPPRVTPRAAQRARRRTTHRGLPALPSLPDALQSLRPTSMVAVLLILCAIAVFGGVFVTNRATAQNAAKFSEATSEDWSLEKDTQETRWLLERPASLPAALPAPADEP